MKPNDLTNVEDLFDYARRVRAWLETFDAWVESRPVKGVSLPDKAVTPPPPPEPEKRASQAAPRPPTATPEDSPPVPAPTKKPGAGSCTSEMIRAIGMLETGTTTTNAELTKLCDPGGRWSPYTHTTARRRCVDSGLLERAGRARYVVGKRRNPDEPGRDIDHPSAVPGVDYATGLDGMTQIEAVMAVMTNKPQTQKQIVKKANVGDRWAPTGFGSPIARLLKRGKIVRVARGTYRLPPHTCAKCGEAKTYRNPPECDRCMAGVQGE